jgi:hypothetical protein
MFEMVHGFERAAANLSPILSVTLGLVTVVAGLFVWLGGLGLRKLLVAIVGAVAGAIAGSFIARENLASTVVSAAGAAALAIIFERIFISILAAASAAVVTFVILAGVYEVDLSGGLKQVCSQMPLHSWPIIAAVAAIFIAGAFYLWRATSALCCAAIGTLLIFAGMILLLLRKGAAPVSYIESRGLFFAAVFIAMTVFGTLEQLLFCKPTPGRYAAKKRATDKKDQERDESHRDWRNR